VESRRDIVRGLARGARVAGDARRRHADQARDQVAVQHVEQPGPLGGGQRRLFEQRADLPEVAQDDLLGVRRGVLELARGALGDPRLADARDDAAHQGVRQGGEIGSLAHQPDGVCLADRLRRCVGDVGVAERI
jgi:hypothetical protein